MEAPTTATAGLESPPSGACTRTIITRMLETSVVVAAVVTIPLVIELEWGARDVLLDAIDWAIWSVFVLDYVVLGIMAPNRREYLLHNWIGLAIVVISFPPLPVLLDVVRLARVVTLLRLIRLATVIARGVGALRAALGRPGLLYVASVTALLILTAAGVLTLVEPDTVKGDYWNGVWWAVVTTTTVGYGDIAPVTPGGRILGAILMFVGIGMVATLAASIAAHFVAQDELKKEEADVSILMKRLDRLEELVREVREENRARANLDESER